MNLRVLWLLPVLAGLAYAAKPPKPVYVAKVNIQDLVNQTAIKERTTNEFLLVFSDGRAWSSLLTEAEIFQAFAPLFADEWTVSDLVVTNTLWDLVTGFGGSVVTGQLVRVQDVADRTEYTYAAGATCRIVLDLVAGAQPPTNAALRIEVPAPETP